MKKLHLINRGETYYAFAPNSYDVVKINEFTYRIIQQLQIGQSKGYVSRAYHIDIAEIEKMEDFFNSLSTNVQDLPKKDTIVNDEKLIHRITLHISNDCNLRCKYCYAEGGNYRSERKLMSKRTAEDFVEFCVREFAEVRNIVFFGGEPFLNLPVILHVCQMFESKHRHGELSYLPKFGAITNGTLLTPQVFDTIKRYFDFLTISIDGPQIVNDANRVDTKGNGSFNRISKFINEVQKIPHLTIQYESTFTDEHIKLGYTHESIRQFMTETFQLSGTVLDEYNMEKELIVDSTTKYTTEDILNHKYPEGFWSILQAIVFKKPKTMCMLYRKNFAVSVEGNIYPCHMDTGIEKCCLGNIMTDNVFSNPQKFLSNHPGLDAGFKNNNLCNNCWARNLCGGCSRLWFYKESESRYSLLPNRSICEKNNKHIENILVNICDIKSNPSKWNAFKEQLQQAKESECNC